VGNGWCIIHCRAISLCYSAAVLEIVQSCWLRYESSKTPESSAVVIAQTLVTFVSNIIKNFQGVVQYCFSFSFGFKVSRVQCVDMALDGQWTSSGFVELCSVWLEQRIWVAVHWRWTECRPNYSRQRSCCVCCLTLISLHYFSQFSVLQTASDFDSCGMCLVCHWFTKWKTWQTYNFIIFYGEDGKNASKKNRRKK